MLGFAVKLESENAEIDGCWIYYLCVSDEYTGQAEVMSSGLKGLAWKK